MRRARRFFDPNFRPKERRQANVLACVLFWSVLSYLAISRAVISGAQVDGDSMVPTLFNGDRVILNRLRYRVTQPARGEVIALDVPGYAGMSVKRIIGLPGETVQIRNQMVYINGKPLDEPYLAPGILTWPVTLSTNVYEIAPNCYFVLGDNRYESLDSRRFGAVERTWIRGRVAGNEYAEYKY